MFRSEMMDVAIGMIFAYLLLSLICSAISELLERWLKNRAGDLEKGLRELLNDPDGSTPSQAGIRPRHDQRSFKGEYDPKAKDKSNLPSLHPVTELRVSSFGFTGRGELRNRIG